MSVEAMAIALHHSQAKGAARLVLLGIANHDGDGGAWPSLATLSKYTGGLDVRTVRRALRELEALGEIETRVNGGGTSEMRSDRRPNRYALLLNCPETCDRSKHHRPRNGGTHTSSRTGGQIGNEGAGMQTREDTRVTHGGAQVSAEPSFEPPLEEGEGYVGTSPARDVEVPPTPEEDLGGMPSTAVLPVSFPERCPDHQHDGATPPCGGCKVARMTHQASLKDAVRREAEAERLRRLEAVRLAREEAARCGLCGPDGRDETGLVCTHDPAVAERARRGAAAARAALRSTTTEVQG